jgi:hypothetical protein
VRQPGNPAFVPLALVNHEHEGVIEPKMLVHVLTIC